MHDLVPAPSAEARRWAMLCHYAAFLGFVVPFIGNVIGPLVVWQLKREDDPFIDRQGKEALNFQLTVTLLHMICWLLVWVLIGFPLMLLVACVAFVLTVIAGIKANQGRDYRYPLTWRMVK